ncbi:MAG: molecular chaperone DnaJ [Patescibacteria group bacterium]
MRDYYDILGVSKGSSQDDIKKAFRKKAHELHPDKGGDEKAFKEVNEAYQVIGDEKKRRTYDQFGHAAFQQGGSPFAGATGDRQGSGFDGFGGGGFDGVNINFDDLGDLGEVFGNMFGFGGGRSAGGKRTRGRDVETTTTISFMESYRGLQKEIQLRMKTACETCKGSGAAEGAKTITCTACNGQGRVMRAQQTPFGVFQTAATCVSCHGMGKKPEKECSACSGTGVKDQIIQLAVSIPAGISDGETIKVAGRGEAAAYGGGSGDLYIHVRVGQDPKFRREGNDIYSEAMATFSVFALGGEMAVETVEGSEKVHIDAGTSSGTTLKLKGKGFPYLHGHGKGDQYVTVIPEIPKKLSKEQKKMLEDLRGVGI